MGAVFKASFTSIPCQRACLLGACVGTIQDRSANNPQPPPPAPAVYWNYPVPPFPSYAYPEWWGLNLEGWHPCNTQAQQPARSPSLTGDEAVMEEVPEKNFKGWEEKWDWEKWTSWKSEWKWIAEVSGAACQMQTCWSAQTQNLEAVNEAVSKQAISNWHDLKRQRTEQEASPHRHFPEWAENMENEEESDGETQALVAREVYTIHNLKQIGVEGQLGPGLVKSGQVWRSEARNFHRASVFLCKHPSTLARFAAGDAT